MKATSGSASGSGQIAFDLNDTLLVSKLIEGNYPNYKQVIPGEMKERVTLERETFLNSLAARLASRQRQIEFDQTQFFQEQYRHHGEHAGSRRSERIIARRLQRSRIFDRV